MEVSSLRDRRLVALFATVVIVGSGAAAAVVGIETRGSYHSPVASQGWYFPATPDSPEPRDAAPPPTPDPTPAVVTVATEDPPPRPSGATTNANTNANPNTSIGQGVAPPPAADDCADAGRGTEDCASLPKPARAPKAGQAIAAEPGVTMAEAPDAEPEPVPVPDRPRHDDAPRPHGQETPKRGPEAKPNDSVVPEVAQADAGPSVDVQPPGPDDGPEPVPDRPRHDDAPRPRGQETPKCGPEAKPNDSVVPEVAQADAGPSVDVQPPGPDDGPEPGPAPKPGPAPEPGPAPRGNANGRGGR